MKLLYRYSDILMQFKFYIMYVSFKLTFRYETSVMGGIVSEVMLIGVVAVVFMPGNIELRACSVE